MSNKLPRLDKFIYDNELNFMSAWKHLLTLARHKRWLGFWETRNWLNAYQALEGGIEDDSCEFEYGYISGMIYAALVIYWPQGKKAINEVLRKIN